jgi:hypothetical protein
MSEQSQKQERERRHAPADQSPPDTPGTQPMNPGDAAPEGTPGTGENICPDCGGSGRRDQRACATCGGTGRVVQGLGGA